MKNILLSKYTGIELFSIYEQISILASCNNARELLEVRTMLLELQPLSYAASTFYDGTMLIFLTFDRID